MTRRFGVLLFCALPALLTWAGEGEKKDAKVDAATLVKATRNIDTDEEEIRSLAFRLEVPGTWRAEALWRAPDRLEFLIRDPTDETPLVFQSDMGLLIYDPLEGKLRVCNTSRAELFLGHMEGEFRFFLSFAPPPDGEDRPPRIHRIRLGVRDLLDATKPDRTVRKMDAGNHALISIAPRSGSIFAIEYDLRRDWPCVGFALQDPERSQPEIEVGPIRVNDELEDARFREFKFDRLKEDFVVETVDLTGETEAELTDVVTRTVHAILVRTALNEPSIRARIEWELQLKLDWDAIAKRDKVLAPRLRALLPE